MIDWSSCPIKYSRQESFKIALDLIVDIPDKSIIEVGCIRSVDDIGAGNSSELFAWFVSNYGGSFLTCDNNYENLLLCNDIISKYRNKKCQIMIEYGDGIQFLKQLVDDTDLLYLDAWDCEKDNFIESAVFHFHMFKAYENRLKSGALVLIDDNLDEKYTGKGYCLIPHLLIEKKYECLYSGYQFLFRKP